MRTKSQEIYARACRVIPGGVSSPVRAFPDLGLLPLVVEKGRGDTIWDVDGNRYIDYCGSWGALILGHAHPAVVREAQEQAERGSSFGITSPWEEALAHEIIEALPSIEKLRFVSSGTEALMTAVRLARGYTNRSIVVKFDGNYHGHADHFLVQAGSGLLALNAAASSRGVPPELVQCTLSLPYNDCEKITEVLRSSSNIAAVVVEPVAGNMGVVPATLEFLRTLRTETERAGALLIFDEVITGFRVGLHGVQGNVGIVPDLTCLAKIIGGGYPAAAVGGKKEIMDHLAPLGEVYQAGTLSGNPVAMCAGYSTLRALKKGSFYQELEEKTALLTEPIVQLIKEKSLNACLQRVGSMFTLFLGTKQVRSKNDLSTVSQSQFKELFIYLFEKGVYIPPSPFEAWFVSAAHTPRHLQQTSAWICAFLESKDFNV